MRLGLIYLHVIIGSWACMHKAPKELLGFLSLAYPCLCAYFALYRLGRCVCVALHLLASKQLQQQSPAEPRRVSAVTQAALEQVSA